MSSSCKTTQPNSKLHHGNSMTRSMDSSSSCRNCSSNNNKRNLEMSSSSRIEQIIEKAVIAIALNEAADTSILLKTMPFKRRVLLTMER